MSIYCLLLEDYVFHPIYLHHLAQHFGPSIIGVSIVTRGARKPNLFRDLKELYAIFGPWYFFVLSVQRFLYMTLDVVYRLLHLPGTFSLQSVAHLHRIPTITVDNINTEKHLAYLQTRRPDILLSSSGQIFGESLLNIPTIACINRHSALLPKYGGVWPVVRAIQCNEKVTGVTMHTMTKKVDIGNILSQKTLPIGRADSLIGIYAKIFRLSVGATIEAVRRLEQGSRGQPMDESKRSYYSYPTREEGALVRKKIPIIRWNEFFLRE